MRWGAPGLTVVPADIYHIYNVLQYPRKTHMIYIIHKPTNHTKTIYIYMNICIYLIYLLQNIQNSKRTILPTFRQRCYPTFKYQQRYIPHLQTHIPLISNHLSRLADDAIFGMHLHQHRNKTHTYWRWGVRIVYVRFLVTQSPLFHADLDYALVFLSAKKMYWIFV